MKKLLSVFAFSMALLSLISCSNEIEQPFDKPVDNPICDNEALIAVTALNARDFFFAPESRDASVSVDKINYITSRTSRSNEEDTLIYVVNFTDNKGFAILSAVDKDDPVYAVTDYGQYTPDGENVTGVDDYINRTKALMQYKRDSINAGNPGDPSHLLFVESVKDTLENVNVLAKLKTHWGQTGFYAKYCPYYSTSTNKGATGCVITAIAMVMSYYSHPESIAIDYNGTSSNMDLNWTEINKHTRTQRNCENGGFGFCAATAEAHDAIAKLMRQLGHMANADYRISNTGVAFTGASGADAASIFNKLGYEFKGYYNYTGADDTKLYRDYILFMLGADSNGKFLSHCFIVDGCRKLTVKTTEKTYDTTYTPWYLVSEREISTVTNNYMHVNWGWDGEADGYYRDNVFNTIKVEERDFPRLSLEEPDSVSYDVIKYATVRKPMMIIL